MNNWKKYTIVAVLLMVALFAYSRNPRNSVPSDFRDAVGFGSGGEGSGARNTVLPGIKENEPNLPVPAAPKPESAPVFKKGDKVLSGNNVRIIESVDDTGRIVLRSDRDGHSQDFVRAAEISLIVDSFGAFKKGDKVLSGNNVRTIESVDNTGRIVLRSDRDGHSQDFVRATEISLMAQ